MYTNLWTLVVLVAVANAEHWIFGAVQPIVTTRLDPVIMPNEASTALIPMHTDPEVPIDRTPVRQVGPHVHSVVGASRFKSVYDPDDLVQSNCTTIPVQPDKSNYWAVGKFSARLKAKTDVPTAPAVSSRSGKWLIHTSPYVHFLVPHTSISLPRTLIDTHQEMEASMNDDRGILSDCRAQGYT